MMSILISEKRKERRQDRSCPSGFLHAALPRVARTRTDRSPFPPVTPYSNPCRHLGSHQDIIEEHCEKLSRIAMPSETEGKLCRKLKWAISEEVQRADKAERELNNAHRELAAVKAKLPVVFDQKYTRRPLFASFGPTRNGRGGQTLKASGMSSHLSDKSINITSKDVEIEALKRERSILASRLAATRTHAPSSSPSPFTSPNKLDDHLAISASDVENASLKDSIRALEEQNRTLQTKIRGLILARGPATMAAVTPSRPLEMSGPGLSAPTIPMKVQMQEGALEKKIEEPEGDVDSL